MKTLILVSTLSVCTALAGCNATMPEALGGSSTGSPQAGCKRLPNSNVENAGIGAVAGAALGAAIGSQTAKKSSVGARNGALIGALGGALAGSQYNNMIGMTQLEDGSVKVNIPGSVMFRTGSSAISPEFGSTLASVAGTIREYCGLSARVVGHTDSTGSADTNRQLSLDRARSTVNFLNGQGVASHLLRQEGRGPDQPIASNANEAGRAQNRRVEIFVMPPSGG